MNSKISPSENTFPTDASFSSFDVAMMQRALALAEKGIYTTTPNPNVGCVITLGERVIGEGYHFRAGMAHAEVFALLQAGEQALGATAYVTLEPCSHTGKTPPCADALIAAGVARVVCAMVDPNPQVAGRGIARLQAAGIRVDVGLCEAQSAALNRGFIKRMQHGLPYVQLKLAASLDGKTALANGKSQWITGSAARADVQAFRAKASAILSTRATVMADDPSLTLRVNELPQNTDYPLEHVRQPLRVLFDSHGNIPASATLFSLPSDVLIIRAEQKAGKAPINGAQIDVVDVSANANGKVDIVAALQLLAARGINTVWVEAGAELAASLIEQKLVDELILYQAPKLMGMDARGLINLTGLTEMTQLPEFEFTDVRLIGRDLRAILRPISPCLSLEQ